MKVKYELILFVLFIISIFLSPLLVALLGFIGFSGRFILIIRDIQPFLIVIFLIASLLLKKMRIKIDLLRALSFFSLLLLCFYLLFFTQYDGKLASFRQLSVLPVTLLIGSFISEETIKKSYKVIRFFIAILIVILLIEFLFYILNNNYIMRHVTKAYFNSRGEQGYGKLVEYYFVPINYFKTYYPYIRFSGVMFDPVSTSVLLSSFYFIRQILSAKGKKMMIIPIFISVFLTGSVIAMAILFFAYILGYVNLTLKFFGYKTKFIYMVIFLIFGVMSLLLFNHWLDFSIMSTYIGHTESFKSGVRSLSLNVLGHGLGSSGYGGVLTNGNYTNAMDSLIGMLMSDIGIFFVFWIFIFVGIMFKTVFIRKLDTSLGIYVILLILFSVLTNTTISLVSTGLFWIVFFNYLYNYNEKNEKT